MVRDLLVWPSNWWVLQLFTQSRPELDTTTSGLCCCCCWPVGGRCSGYSQSQQAMIYVLLPFVQKWQHLFVCPQEPRCIAAAQYLDVPLTIEENAAANFTGYSEEFLGNFHSHLTENWTWNPASWSTSTLWTELQEELKKNQFDNDIGFINYPPTLVFLIWLSISSLHRQERTEGESIWLTNLGVCRLLLGFSRHLLRNKEAPIRARINLIVINVHLERLRLVCWVLCKRNQSLSKYKMDWTNIS